MNSNILFIAFILSLVIWVFSAVGITLFVVYRILNRYNDYGNFVCPLEEYSKNGIRYTRVRDNVLPMEKNEYFMDYGYNPYEDIERSIPEQLLKNQMENR